jgi:Ca2+-transporting ATPase
MTVTAPPTGHPATTAELWYMHRPDQACAAMGVDPATGLSTQRAAELLAQHGPNALPGAPQPSILARFTNQYHSYMQIILLVAAVVSLAVQDWSTAVLLVILTVFNALIGLRQEGKAASATRALQAMMKASARVRRDGIEAEIPAENVVAGDIVVIAAGDQVPADGLILEAHALQIDESALTGESTPASKQAGALDQRDLGPGDQTNMAFMNTPVTHGDAVVLVTGTGAQTELGRISTMLSAAVDEQSPLTVELNRLTIWIGLAAGLTVVIMILFGWHRHQPFDAIFTSAITLAIAAMPEALPTVTQVILSLGSTDLARRKAIVRELPAVESLGFASAINSDKTGTLTMNQMTVTEVIAGPDRFTLSGTGYGLEGRLHRVAGTERAVEPTILPYLIANDGKIVEGKVVGDPTEGALLVLAAKAGIDIDATRDRFPRRAVLPFDPTYKLMAVFTAIGDAEHPTIRCFVKGAAPAVVERTTSIETGTEQARFDTTWRSRMDGEIHRMERDGHRVMAAGVRDIDPAEFDANANLLDYVVGLTLTSLVGMVDPPRESSKASVHAAQSAHMRVRMVTGDDVITGAAIADQLGIPGEAILGADFAALSESDRVARIEDIGVVGRVAPEHKVLLVETLKKRGDVVAMTGDGVNDAPAIKRADIGIAMGSGTEVAKQASRLILADDNFATIVFAVEQGRKIYDNLTKYIRFVLILLVVFILTFLVATAFNILAGEPFTTAQVLWIHFVVNAPFGFALGFDKETPGLMQRTPERRGQSALTPGNLATIGLAGVTLSIGLLLTLHFALDYYHDNRTAQSMAFLAFAFGLIVAALECRSLTDSIFAVETFASPQMNRTIAAQLALAVLTVQVDGFNRILDTVPLTLQQFEWSLAAPAALLVIWEAGKLLARKRKLADTRAPTNA